jgi:hypothetical protein
MRREITSDDVRNNDIEGLIDFSKTPLGGLTVAAMPVKEREYERFMADPITLMVGSSGDIREPPTVKLWLNGVELEFPRKRPVRIPRAYFEIIIGAQQRDFMQQEVYDPSAAEGMRTRMHVTTQYPYNLIHDPSPKGPAWMRRVARETA